MAGLLARGSVQTTAFPLSQWPPMQFALRLQLRGQPRLWSFKARYRVPF
jgi:hypothetical protein